jgi:hypothetical protein
MKCGALSPFALLKGAAFAFAAASLFGGAALSLAAEPPAPTTVEFNRDVRPILSDNCFFCHGPDAKNRKADLRLDVREVATTSKAIVPRNTRESELVKRILTNNVEELMPPPDSHKKLTARQKEILERWIAQGAAYQQHWSYERPVKAQIPADQNGVDTLVRQRLNEIGLQPSPEADRRILVRRLYWDLLGLPPTPEEAQAFINDASPNAYERLVDRLLDNPHYGERMAIGWLDVARFADTIGYHSDNPRNIWPYRDWVIRSFNDNKPFDRFTLEQVAGDLLPDANRETRIGSAFNRLLLSTEEGGAQAKDYEARMLTDRVRSIGAAWLGQTTGCAQCHDHKFDPFTTRDFYSLGAFFADLQEPIIGKREDGMVVATPEEEKRLAELDAALDEAKKKFDVIAPLLDVAQQQWEADVIAYGITLPELAKDAKPNGAEKQLADQATHALKKDAAARNGNEKQQLQTYFRSKATRLYQAERDGLAKAEQERKSFYDALTKCLVSVSGKNKRIVRVLPRGNWMDESGEPLQPALPHYLPQPTIEGRELTRLDLAQWLVARDNPLTARVVINRLWKQFFGAGLCKTLDDLGAQGEPPANPLLLDWLACEFVDSGWDVKHMVRAIVNSATYRQVSTASPALLAADPYNRELARQSAFRVDAECVRDNALAISGLLAPRIGGPSVKPYQPGGYWENLNFPPRDYPADKGENQYRRGLYTWWQRSFLHPSMLAFDAPTREECCAERTRSNIPQQALVQLNDPTYVEAARVFAARILSECPRSGEDRLTESRLNWAWQQALQRSPRAEEVVAMNDLVARHLAIYRENSGAAAALLATGQAPVADSLDKAELAAWTHVARVLLNLHETITRF